MDIAGNRTLYSIFASYAAEMPSREWLVYEYGDGRIGRWSYGQFLDTVHQSANLLAALGVAQGSVVILHLRNHPVHVQLVLAASYLGAVVLPTNPASTADELSYLVEHAEAKVIITEPDCLDIVRQMPVGEVLICDVGEIVQSGERSFEAELAQQPTIPPDAHGTSDNVVELLYTSGTTSRPKGVMLTNATLIYGAEVFRAGCGLRADDTHLIALPLFHAAAQCHALFPSLITGARIVLLPRFSASRYFAQAAEYGATMAALFGAPLRMLLNQPESEAERAHHLRNITFAQNLSDAQYARWHERFGVPLQQLWGMTETGGLPLMSPLTGRRNLAAMGRPVLGYEVKVLQECDGGFAVAAPGEMGALVVRGVPGRTVMLGYLKNEEATRKTLRKVDDQTLLFTGDTAYYDEDGFFYFVDRDKDIIKRAGENISSTEVERVILGHPDVLDVCVIGIPDPLRDESVVAVVVRKQPNLTADDIRAVCRQRLAAFKVPERVEFVEALPRTSVGKIQKNLVREQLIGQK